MPVAKRVARPLSASNFPLGKTGLSTHLLCVFVAPIT